MIRPVGRAIPVASHRAKYASRMTGPSVTLSTWPSGAMLMSVALYYEEDVGRSGVVLGHVQGVHRAGGFVDI